MGFYGASVVGGILLIAAGTQALTEARHPGLRPALIAAVVGLQFIPFAWVWGSGCSSGSAVRVSVLGAAGLLAGAVAT